LFHGLGKEARREENSSSNLVWFLLVSPCFLLTPSRAHFTRKSFTKFLLRDKLLTPKFSQDCERRSNTFQLDDLAFLLSLRLSAMIRPTYMDVVSKDGSQTRYASPQLVKSVRKGKKEGKSMFGRVFSLDSCRLRLVLSAPSSTCSEPELTSFDCFTETPLWQREVHQTKAWER